MDAIKHLLSRRPAAERFGVSAPSAIRWLCRLGTQGGDRRSGRIEAEAAFLLGEVAKTLVELQEKLLPSGVSAGIATLITR